MKRMRSVVFLLILLGSGLMAQAQFGNKNKKRQAAATDANKSIDEVTILGIKSKFLAKDSTSVTVFMRVDLTKPNNVPVRWREFTEKFTLNYVVYPPPPPSGTITASRSGTSSKSSSAIVP